jgi:hypothetical protein
MITRSVPAVVTSNAGEPELAYVSWTTPWSHVHRTDRNFFPPEAPWQFLAPRLAGSVS